MKILIISQYFWPENFRVNDLTLELSKKYTVEVLTTIPSYPNNKLFGKNNNNFKGIKINRISSVPRKGGKISIFINYLTFFLSLVLNLLLKKKYREFDLIIVFQPSPITPVLAAGIYKKIFNKPIITWVLDYWPETLFDLNIVKNSLLKKILKIICKRIYLFSDLILAQSKSMAIKIKKDIKGLKVKTLYSWSEDYFVKQKNYRKRNKKNFKIIFSGNIGEAQNLINLIKVIKITTNFKNNIQWIFVGDGSKRHWLINKIKFLKIEKNFKFYSYRPTRMIPHIYKKADAGLISLKKGLTFKNTLPAKFQSYLAFGLPIFSFASGETYNLTKEYKLGLYCEPNNPKKFAYQISKFSKFSKKQINKIIKNNRNVYKSNFSKKKAIHILDQEIKKLAK